VGQYLPGRSVLHRRDARLKLLGTVALSVALFALDGWLGLGVLGVALGLGFVLVRAPAGYLWRGLRPLALLLALTFVFQAFGYVGEPLFALGPFTVTREGLDHGGFLTLRLALLLLAGTLLTLTTSPVALTDAVEWVLAPLRRIGLPSHELALMMTIALRFIPTLTREMDGLVRAQRARGLELRVRDPRRLAQALLPLAVPLFVLTFRRADDLAVAMTSRCYRGGRGRTRFREAHFGLGDAVGAAVAALVLAASLTAGRWWA